MKRIIPKKTVAQVRAEYPEAYEILKSFIYDIAKLSAQKLGLGLEEAIEKIEPLFDKGYFKLVAVKEDGISYVVLQKWFEDKEYYDVVVDPDGRRRVLQLV